MKLLIRTQGCKFQTTSNIVYSFKFNNLTYNFSSHPIPDSVNYNEILACYRPEPFYTTDYIIGEMDEMSRHLRACSIKIEPFGKDNLSFGGPKWPYSYEYMAENAGKNKLHVYLTGPFCDKFPPSIHLLCLTIYRAK